MEVITKNFEVILEEEEEDAINESCTDFDMTLNPQKVDQKTVAKRAQTEVKK